MDPIHSSPRTIISPPTITSKFPCLQFRQLELNSDSQPSDDSRLALPKSFQRSRYHGPLVGRGLSYSPSYSPTRFLVIGHPDVLGGFDMGTLWRPIQQRANVQWLHWFWSGNRGRRCWTLGKLTPASSTGLPLWIRAWGSLGKSMTVMQCQHGFPVSSVFFSLN